MAGDEIFAGYRRHLAAKWFDALRWLPEPICRIARRDGQNKIRRSAAGLTSRFLRGLPLTPAERWAHASFEICMRGAH
jgi:hypothetical protein